MGIFDETKESRAIKKLSEAEEMSKAVESALRVAIPKGFNTVWNNEEMTPQEVFNLMGNKAAYALNLSKFGQLLLKAIDPEYNFLVPNQKYVTNEDGTVTVTETTEVVSNQGADSDQPQ